MTAASTATSSAAAANTEVLKRATYLHLRSEAVPF